jgi:sugar lactone lactonase YvrE
VAILDTTPGATIYYTTNGTYPNGGSSVYSGPITVSTSEIVLAMAIAPGYSNSTSATAEYYIDSSSSRFIYTIAGTDTPSYSGDGGPATFAELNPNALAVDGAANVYITDIGTNVVRKITAATGIITTIAGTGVAGHTGDNGPASSAELWTPNAIAVDPTGDIFISESGDNVVRRIDAVTGTITTFAGNPTGTGTIGGAATSFPLSYIVGLACDHLGNLYIAEQSAIFEVNAGSGNISLIASSTSNNNYPSFNGIAVDSGLNVYASAQIYYGGYYGVVLKINPQGLTAVFAGASGATGGDGGPATSAGLSNPAGLAVDAAGNVYIADLQNYAIREVNTSGIINTVAGIFSNPNVQIEDGSPATDVSIYPQNIAIDTAGNLYFADQEYYRVREIMAPAAPPSATAAAPVLSLAAGTYAGSQTLTMTDATPGAEIYVSLNGVAVNTGRQGYHGPIEITGTVTVQAIAVAPGYLASAPVSATYTITTPPTAVISTVAGNGEFGLLGVGGPALNAEIGYPQAVTFDGAGNLYIADPQDYVVWMVAASTGNITIAAGTGTSGNGSDGGLATATELGTPEGVAVDKLGNLYISDTSNGRIRMVTALTGAISTVAGTGQYSGTLGDGGLATAAYLAYPQGIAFDGAGNLYIADTSNNRIRMINASTGIISTVAGGGTGAQLGDGGLATAAYLAYPQDVTLDHAGNLYISDRGNSRIREVVVSTGVINTIAGNGTWGDTGDGGMATAAQISPDQGIVLDAAGDIYFSSWPDTIREVNATTGIISTIAGDGYFGYGGDGGSATIAELNYPLGLALDASGSLNIADFYNHVVRKVTFPGPAPTPAFNVAGGTYHSIQTVSISDSVNAAAIYYTTDGSTPTTASTLYSGPITVSASETLQAIAVATGYTESAVATAAYTIILPATPVITWPIPAPITYGTALSVTQLDATSTIAGTFAYTPAAGAVLTAGAQTLSVTFTPTDSIDYSTATASVTLQVNQATPSITWSTPAAITYGTPLSANQLDAASTVAGSFAYTPKAGTVLTAGPQTLTTTFTPTDAADYTTATDTVQLTVNRAVPTVTVTPSPSSITTVQPLSVAVLVNDGGGNPTPTGAVTLTGGGYTSPAVTLSSGAATINISASSLSPGSDTLTATYTPDSSSSTMYSSAMGTASEAVTAPGPAASMVTVTPSLTTITNEQSDTVSIAVTGTGAAAPSGTVTLSSGSFSAQQALAGGAASFNIPAGALNNGANTVTAAYSGDATYNSSQGTATITVSQVVMTVSTPSAVNPGASTKATVTFSTSSTYSGTLNMACVLATSPAGAQDLPTCSLSPASVTLAAGGSGTTQLTVTTTASSVSVLARPSRQNLWGLGGGAVLAALMMFGIPLRRSRWLSMLALIAVVAVAGMVGCGGGKPSTPPVTNPGTTAGAYTFSVTGTDSANSTITTSTNVTITVQ